MKLDFTYDVEYVDGKRIIIKRFEDDCVSLAVEVDGVALMDMEFNDESFQAMRDLLAKAGWRECKAQEEYNCQMGFIALNFNGDMTDRGSEIAPHIDTSKTKRHYCSSYCKNKTARMRREWKLMKSAWLKTL